MCPDYLPSDARKGNLVDRSGVPDDAAIPIVGIGVGVVGVCVGVVRVGMGVVLVLVWCVWA